MRKRVALAQALAPDPASCDGRALQRARRPYPSDDGGRNAAPVVGEPEIRDVRHPRPRGGDQHVRSRGRALSRPSAHPVATFEIDLPRPRESPKSADAGIPRGAHGIWHVLRTEVQKSHAQEDARSASMPPSTHARRIAGAHTRALVGPRPSRRAARILLRRSSQSGGAPLHLVLDRSVLQHLVNTLVETMLSFVIARRSGWAAAFPRLTPFLARVFDPFIKAVNSMRG